MVCRISRQISEGILRSNAPDHIMNSAGVNAEVKSGLNNAELVNKDSFERLKSKNRRKEFRRRIFYFFISLFLCATVALICIVFFFDLKHIEIRGNEKYSQDEILAVCGFDENTNLFGINFDATEVLITKQFSYIRSVDFKRVFPSTLIITVVEDVPMWFTHISDDWFVLSDDLRVISRYDLKEEVELLDFPLTYINLPEIDYAVTGEMVKFTKASNYNYTVSFLKELENFDFCSSVDSIDASDRYHISVYSGGGKYKINLGTSENLEAKIKFVLKVIEEAFDENTIASIDVEYLTSIIVLKQDELFSYP